jgi:hypothetical protein
MLYLFFFLEIFRLYHFLFEKCAGYGNYLRKNLIFKRKITKYIGYIYIHFIGANDETYLSAQ